MRHCSFTAPIFVKLTNAQRHYVQISYTYFHPNRAINLERMERRPLTPLSEVHYNDFHTTQNLPKGTAIEFHTYRSRDGN